MKQKLPLRKKQLAKLQSEARRIGGDTWKTFILLRRTGMHISPIFTTKGKLHEEKDDDNDDVIIWYRPKKEGEWARTEMLKHRDIDFNVTKFAQEVQKRKRKKSRQYFRDLLRTAGENVGISDVSPMTLRHSLAVEMLDDGVPEVVVAQMLNISPRTMKWYGRYTNKGLKDVLKRMGW